MHSGDEKPDNSEAPAAAPTVSGDAAPTVSGDPDEGRSTSWFEDEVEEETGASFREYEIIASPNDFNVKTIVDFVSSGAVKIPGFQRNYVWDLKRASKFIESILIGLPIPQIFLYEEKKNSFLVIDGQQRLMSIYYYVKGRFPRKEKRPALRRILDKERVFPQSIIADDQYFQKFNLSLASTAQSSPSRFHGKNYETLDDYKMSFDLRTIRNIVIKQISPQEEQDTSVFEIFNRLNTGGINLRPQEIRASLYHSPFIEALHRVNLHPIWRSLIGLQDPDLHDKDVEILLRVFALVADGDSYHEPMSGFLNAFAKKARVLPEAKLQYMESLFGAFFTMLEGVSHQSFSVAKSGRFSIAIFEAVFWAACEDAFKKGTLDVIQLKDDRLQALKEDEQFIGATRFGVGRAVFVKTRHERAAAILKS